MPSRPEPRRILDIPHFRQVISYWEMAAAMVLHGAVSAEVTFGIANGVGERLRAGPSRSPSWIEIRAREPRVSGEDVGVDHPVFRRGAALTRTALKSMAARRRSALPAPQEANAFRFFIGPKSAPQCTLPKCFRWWMMESGSRQSQLPEVSCETCSCSFNCCFCPHPAFGPGCRFHHQRLDLRRHVRRQARRQRLGLREEVH